MEANPVIYCATAECKLVQERRNYKRTRRRWCWLELLFLCLILLSFPFVSAETTVVETYAMKTVVFGSDIEDLRETAFSGFIYSHAAFNRPYTGNKKGFITIEAPVGYRIRLTALYFSVNGNPNTECETDSLYVFDKGEEKNSALTNLNLPGSISQIPGQMIGTFCGFLPNGTKIAETTDNKIFLYWHTEKDSRGGKGFKLVWTFYRDLPKPVSDRSKNNLRWPYVCSFNIKAGVDEFGCFDGRECIPRQIVCDPVAHCSDRSDATKDVRRSEGCKMDQPSSNILGSLGTAALAGICVACVLILVIMCVAVSICCRENCSSKSSTCSSNQTGLEAAFVGDQRHLVAQPANTSSPSSHNEHVMNSARTAPPQQNNNRMNHCGQKLLPHAPYHGPGRGENVYVRNGHHHRYTPTDGREEGTFLV